MKRASVGLLIGVVIVSLIFAFAVFVQQEKQKQEVLDARATAVTGSNLYGTAEAEREMVAGTAVALATTLHEQQIETTAVAETAVANVTTLEETLAESQTQQANVESELYEQQQNALANKLALSSYQVRERSYPDWQLSTLLAVEAVNHAASIETTAALANSLELLSNLAMNMEGVHPDATELMFSQDGSSLLAWGWRKEAVLWDVSTGEQLFSTPIKGEGRGLSSDGCFLAVENWPILDIIDMCRGETAFSAPTRFGSSVAFSPDNQLLAYSTTVVPDDSEDVSTWWEFFAVQNLQSGEEIIKEKITPVDERISAAYKVLTFNADGSLVAGANLDEVHVWDVSTKRIITKFANPMNYWPEKLVFSPDNTYLAVVGFNGAILWNLSLNQPVPLETFTGGTQSTQFSSDSRYLLITKQEYEDAGEYGNWYEGYDVTQVWDLESGEEILSLPGLGVSASFTGEDGLLAGIDRRGFYQVWNFLERRLISQTVVNIPQSHNIGPLRQIALSSDGKLVAVNHQGNISLWSSESFQPLQTLYPMRVDADRRTPDDLQTIAFSPDGTILVTGGIIRGDIRFWDTSNGRELDNYQAGEFSYPDSPHVIIYSPDGKYLVLGNGNFPNPAPDWRESGGTIIQHLATNTVITLTHGAWVKNLVFSADGRYFATASDKAEVWDLNGQAISTCLPEESSLDIAFSPDGENLFTLTPDQVGVCHVDSGEVLKEYFPPNNGKFTAMDLSENGRFLAVSEGQTVHIWDRQINELVTDIATTFPADKLQLSSDGKYLIARSRNEFRQGFIEVWKIGDERPLLSIPHSFGDFALSPDGQVIAIADGSNVVRVLSLFHGHEINRVKLEENIEQVIFRPDGKQLALRGRRETVGLWYWNASDLVAEACSRLTRNLSADEWYTYVDSEPYHLTCPELRIP
ncbi:MAG: WD40 repeat domain-containing protein [Ardenticatenaceae bacterium]|nr:WD40 repeat domain-containing protein [Ardenticatenaceae bacterium]